MSTETEWDLIRRCRRGSEHAFEPLVRQHEAAALALARGLLGDADEAADAVQDAFVRAYRSLDRLRPGSAFGPWFRTILRNLCRDRLRSARRRRGQRWSAEAVDRRVWTEPAGPTRVARGELAESVRAALDELSEAHRTVLVLKEMEGLSYAEIARTLEVSSGTVASRLHHARAALGDVLRERGISREDIVG